jgi:16S rRNA (uracil1498-N3)-methyltransferase
MYNFFVDIENKQDDLFLIKGSDYNHLINVLRFKKGDEFLVTCNGVSNLCLLEDYSSDTAFAKIITSNYQNTELPIKIHLFQGLPKSDKLELIIQKAVELGVYEIIPTEMARCVVKFDDKKKSSKIERFNLISESAAKQSKRNVIPKVLEVMSYKNALEYAKTLDLLLIPYECENGMQGTKTALSKIKSGMSVGIIIGSEGGFSESEVELAKALPNAMVISLGKRILRTETAAISTISTLMMHSELNLD